VLNENDCSLAEEIERKNLCERLREIKEEEKINQSFHGV